MDISEFIKNMPKVELHLHLEGAIKPGTAQKLIAKNSGKNISLNEIKNLYEFATLGEFVNGMRQVSNNVKTLDDLALITREMLLDLVQQNVIYVEFDCAVQKYLNLGHSFEKIVDTIYEQAQLVSHDFEIIPKMIVNLQRDHGVEVNNNLVEKTANLNHALVVGVGLSGDEKKYPNSMFKETFQMAKQYGLNRTVHAGEVCGATSVWQAINDLDAQRIDHGTRSIDDPALLDYLKENKIPLTQCLTSNVKLNVVTSYDKHPFQKFYEKDLNVSLHTDDPNVFQTTLLKEYEIAATVFKLSKADLLKIAKNAVQASFSNDKDKLNRLYENLSK